MSPYDRIDAAREAACSPAHDTDRQVAVSTAALRLKRSAASIEAILADVWRAGFRAGHMDATRDAWTGEIEDEAARIVARIGGGQ